MEIHPLLEKENVTTPICQFQILKFVQPRRLGLALSLLLVGCSLIPSSSNQHFLRPVTTLPESIRANLELSPFYRKFTQVHGLAIVSSEKVNDRALLEAATLVHKMIGHHVTLLETLGEAKLRIAVLAATEMTTDIPEHSTLNPAAYWNENFRGIGATPTRLAMSSGEENLLGFPGDPHAGRSRFIYDFANTIRELGLRRLTPDFHQRLEACYRASALAQQASAADLDNYWAKATQSWFGSKKLDSSSVAQAAGPRSDPQLAKLLTEVYGASPWSYKPPRLRQQAPHLRGLDFSKLPLFSWPTTQR